ncbi:Chitinase 2 [Coemansia sp. RSA 552]|nr:Chitinase 2 [Coemansia sp. RSA 552]
MKQLVILLLLHLWRVIGANGERFNINCNSNLVMYWGQNSHAVSNPNENQLPLDEYCDKNTGDVLVLSFLSEFNADALHPPTLNFANACTTSFDNSTLLHCSNIGKAISKCQKQGKIVLLSMGGASGAYGFADDVQAERYADEMWDMFLGGTAKDRPFDGAVIDGIDLDIEGGSSVGYVRFVQRLRERFTEVGDRRFYVSAAPQCPYPDFYSGPILDNAYLDMVFVQFYNNYCGVDHPNWFNFEQWHDWATTTSANKDVRVYLGVPGSPTAASTGHVTPERLEEIVNATRSKFDTFGGMMVWDASQADYNHVRDDTTFAAMARQMLDSDRNEVNNSDVGHLAAEHLNQMTVGGLDLDDSTTSEDDSSTDETADTKSTPTTDEDDSTATEDKETEDVTTEEVTAGKEKSSEDESTEDTTDDDEVTEEKTVTPSDGNETTTVESTRVLHSTSTRTRKIHIVTKHITKHVRKMDNDVSALTEPSPTTSNKTVSIVTPTFPLPIARCPRADQPCLGAGFACNGYEFGQCVNNRWLMRPCSTDKVTACFNAGPDLVACDFPKGRSLQVCDDILAPLPYGRLASNVLFLRGSDQERALNTPVYPVPSESPSVTTPVKKKKKKYDYDDDDDTDDDDDDYVYNKYGEKKKNTAMSTTTDMELIKQSSGVNLIDDHNRREDPAMLMAKDPEAYYGPDGHVRVVGGNIVDDLRKHNSMGTANEPYNENPPVDDPEEADEYSKGDEFMRKRDLGDIELDAPSDTEETDPSLIPPVATSTALRKRESTDNLVGSAVSMTHLNERPWRSQVEDFYSIYALYSAFSGITSDMEHQQFERVILDHIDGDFLVAPRLPALSGHPLLARFTFVPLHGEDSEYMHHRTKDGMVEQDVLVVVRMLTNVPIPRRWRVALPLSSSATMLHTSRGSFYAGDRVSAEVKSFYMQRVAFYNENIRLAPHGPELQHLNGLAAGHTSNATAVDREFNVGPSYDSVRRSLISPSAIKHVLHQKPSAPPPPELLDAPIPDDPAGRLYEVRSDPKHERENNMALYFSIRVKTHPSPHGPVAGALPHPILSFITTH